MYDLIFFFAIPYYKKFSTCNAYMIKPQEILEIEQAGILSSCGKQPTCLFIDNLRQCLNIHILFSNEIHLDDRYEYFYIYVN